MKILGLLLLPLLLGLASCSTPKTIALTGEVVSENVVASSTIFDVSFSHFTFNDTSYLVEVLPIGAKIVPASTLHHYPIDPYSNGSHLA